jgi:hypothetical protein
MLLIRKFYNIIAPAFILIILHQSFIYFLLIDVLKYIILGFFGKLSCFGI